MYIPNTVSNVRLVNKNKECHPHVKVSIPPTKNPKPEPSDKHPPIKARAKLRIDTGIN
ncbi:hypothetical protein J6TS2_41550 [Heyndrickxia sporothermodurans]|nr:hypothetical protein J6TS2_41550 [Heyndrickxia sporothermodurans]